MKTMTRVAVGIVALGTFTLPATAASADPAWCGQIITTPGTVVTLTANLACDGTALTVAADNVTVDLAGFTIKGGWTDPSATSGGDPRYDGYSVGIRVTGASGARITGGTIRSFDAGIVADHSSNLLVDTVVLDASQYWGMWATAMGGLSVEHSTVSGTWTPGDEVPMGDGYYPEAGIEIHDSGGVNVTDSSLSGIRGNGVLTLGVTNLTVSGTEAANNAGDGVQAWTTTGAFTVRNSTFEGNENGIQFDHTGSSGSVTIDTVDANKNRSHGVLVDDLRQATITGVNASGNGGVGIWLSSGLDATTGNLVSFHATISGSTATSNGQDGIAFDGLGAWYLTNNTATGNAGDGFVAIGGRITSSGNAANKNLSNGFLWDMGTTGTSTSDSASTNTHNGVRVNVGSGNAVSLTDLYAASSGQYGVLVSSGRASVSRGTFRGNSLDGIRVASGGTGYVTYANAVKNSGNGVAFVAGSTGYGYHLTASSNGRYGLCTDPASSYRNYPPHSLLFNGAGAYGHTCDGFIFIPWWF